MRTIAIFHLPGRGIRDEFEPLRGDPGMRAEWVKPSEFHSVFPDGADVIVLPGSRTTVTDLDALRVTGGEAILRQHLAQGGTVVGICGGYQILGNALYDPALKQGREAVAEGLGLLPIRTAFGPEMMSTETSGRCLLAHSDDMIIGGQEHRSGFSWEDAGAERYHRLNAVEKRTPMKPLPVAQPLEYDHGREILWAPGSEPVDGFVSADRRLWGTYIHLIFHYSAFCRAVFQPV